MDLDQRKKERKRSAVYTFARIVREKATKSDAEQGQNVTQYHYLS